MRTYLAVFRPVKEGGYFVRFPDVENALTQGGDLEQGFEMAVDALALVLADHKRLPKATKAEELAPSLSSGEFLVPVPLDEGLLRQYAPKKRINVMLPEDVLAALDSYRARTGEDRSSLLAKGAWLLLEQEEA